jgi:hypothetical protein
MSRLSGQKCAVRDEQVVRAEVGRKGAAFWAECASSVVQGGLEGAAQVAVS